MERFLSNKKVLFIGYEYFDYHIKIRKALADLGAVVEYYPVLNYNLLFTVLRRVSHTLFLKYNRNYGKKILKEIENKVFDYVFVIQGQQLPSDFYTKLRRQFSSAYFINYHWDSIHLTEFGNTLLDIIPFFDRAYSFDREDCNKYNRLSYLPLFHTIEKIEETGKIFDIAFVGSVASLERYKFIKKVENNCLELGLKFHFIMYVPLRTYIRFMFQGIRLRDLTFKQIPYEKVKMLYSSARAVIDVPNHIQSGLTMRTIEALAAGAKLITTNVNIIKEPFYNETNIQVINTETLMPNKEFVTRDVEPLDMSKYHLNQWLKKLFIV